MARISTCTCSSTAGLAETGFSPQMTTTSVPGSLSAVSIAASDTISRSLDCGYLANEREMVSLATIDTAFSEPGTEVIVVWGEQPVSAKPAVEEHVQVEIRATVAPSPTTPGTPTGPAEPAAAHVIEAPGTIVPGASTVRAQAGCATRLSNRAMPAAVLDAGTK